MRRLTLATLIGAAALAAPAYAYTPQSGLWWNPNESGTGFTIELQDDLMVFTAFVGDPLGTGGQEWYTAAGFLDPTATFFQADLYVTEGSQCAGCSYPGPADEFVVGTVTIEFDPEDEGRGELTYDLSSPNLPPRTVEVERFVFFPARAEDGNAPIEERIMLGEWNLTLDLSRFPNFTGFKYNGDVLVFDLLDFDTGLGIWFFEGCRAEDSLDRRCTNLALLENPAAGFYDETVNRQAIIVVDEASGTNCVYYEADVGPERFFGGGDFTDADDGGFALYPCDDDPLFYPMYPVRGFRTASRSFVQDRVGPSKAEQTAAAGDTVSRGMSSALPAPQRAREKRAVNPEFARKLDLLRQHMLDKRAATE